MENNTILKEHYLHIFIKRFHLGDIFTIQRIVKKLNFKKREDIYIVTILLLLYY